MYLGLPVVDLDLLPDFKAKYNGKTVTTEEVVCRAGLWSGPKRGLRDGARVVQPPPPL